MKLRQALPLLLTTASALFLPASCALVAAAGVGVLVTDELRDDSISVVLPVSPEFAWKGACWSLGQQSTAFLHVDETKRTARTTLGHNVEQGTVIVAVEDYDQGRARVIVDANKFGVHNPERSREVLARIEADIMAQKP